MKFFGVQSLDCSVVIEYDVTIWHFFVALRIDWTFHFNKHKCEPKIEFNSRRNFFGNECVDDPLKILRLKNVERTKMYHRPTQTVDKVWCQQNLFCKSPMKFGLDSAWNWYVRGHIRNTYIYFQSHCSTVWSPWFRRELMIWLIANESFN